MDRRKFLGSLFAIGGAVAAGALLIPSKSEAATLDGLTAGEAPAVPDADMPAPGAQEVQGFARRRVVRRRAVVRRRRVVVRRRRVVVRRRRAVVRRRVIVR